MASILDGEKHSSEEFVVLPRENEVTDSLHSDFSLIPMVESSAVYELVNGKLCMTNAPSVNQLTEEEVQKLTLDLLECNRNMQEKLNHNNIMMKDQFSTISEWHNRVTTSMAQQQLSLREAEEKLISLQQENDTLKEDIAKYQTNSKTDAECQTSNIEFSNKEINGCTFNQDVCLKPENLDLKSEEQNSLSSEKLLEQIDQVKATLKKNEYMLEKLEKDNIVENPAEELKKNEEMVLMIETLKLNVYHEKQTAETERILHAQTKELYNVLQSKYEQLLKQLNQEKTKKDSNYESISDKKYIEQIDSLVASKFDLEQKLQEKINELQSLKANIGDVTAMKAQVEVLRNDLESTQKAKEEADFEIQALTEQLNELQFGHPIHARKKSKEDQKNKRDIESAIIVCPLCDFGFTDLKAAENHVNSCLDKKEYGC